MPVSIPVNPYGDIEREARALRACQRVAAGGAVASMAAGAVLLGWPDHPPAVVAGVLGGWLVACAVLRLAEAIGLGFAPGAGHPAAGHAPLPAVAGLAQLTVGVLLLRGVVATPELVAVVVGVAGLAGGISELAPAVAGARGGWARSAAVTSGLVAVAGGLALALLPGWRAPALAPAAGVWLLAQAAVQGAIAVRAARPADAS